MRSGYLRLVATAGVLAAVAWTHTGTARPWGAVLILAAYCATAAGLMVAAHHLRIRPAFSRPVSLLADVSVATLSVYYAGDGAAAMLPVYVTLSAEYGMRLGTRYLWWTANLSAVGLVCVLLMDAGALQTPLLAVGVVGCVAIAAVYLDALPLHRNRASRHRWEADGTLPPAVTDSPVGGEPGPTRGAKSEAPLVDHQILDGLQHLDQNGEFLPTLVDGFIQETESLARDLQQATEALDDSAYRDCLYALKGSAANIGASQLHQLCRQALAADAGSGDTACSDWLSRIRQCIRLTHETLLDSGVVARAPQHQG